MIHPNFLIEFGYLHPMKFILGFFLLFLCSFSNAQQVVQLDSLAATDTFSNILVKRISGDSVSSSFLIWVKKEVPIHFHIEHSEHVMLLEGAGLLVLGDSTYHLTRGNWVFIPKGIPHSFVTTSDSPAKVLSIQAPHFDGTDRHKP